MSLVGMYNGAVAVENSTVKHGFAMCPAIPLYSCAHPRRSKTYVPTVVHMRAQSSITHEPKGRNTLNAHLLINKMCMSIRWNSTIRRSEVLVHSTIWVN